ncbi:hypothetical protein P486_01175 [Mycobacterium tuberculosis TKK_04_0003]|nr:hypothetical protein P486_01175 [Mycobacterium tuberculosis TKK_04_0003]
MGRSVRHGDDLFGRNVAMTARVAGQAVGGQILVGEPVHDAVSDCADIRFGSYRLF